MLYYFNENCKYKIWFAVIHMARLFCSFKTFSIIHFSIVKYFLFLFRNVSVVDDQLNHFFDMCHKNIACTNTVVVYHTPIAYVAVNDVLFRMNVHICRETVWLNQFSACVCVEQQFLFYFEVIDTFST